MPMLRPSSAAKARDLSESLHQRALSRHDWKHDTRRTFGVVKDRLIRRPELGGFAERRAGVRIAVEPGEVAAGDLETDAVASGEHVACGPHLDRHGFGAAGRQ